MGKVTWYPQVHIENNPTSSYNINDFKPPKKRFKLKIPPEYRPNSDVKKDVAKKLIRYVSMKLDWTLLNELLNNKKFVRKYLELIHLEIILGKALISGHLAEAKKFVKVVRKIEKYKDLKVTDAFFVDLIKRRKKTIKDFEGLVLMTVIRQGNSDTVQFTIDNLNKDISLKTCYVRDGDMTFSFWTKHKEVHELTKEEKLIEAMPKDKIFQSLFDDETPLSAVLRNSIKTKTDKIHNKLLETLLKSGADPFAKRYQAFKVAARYGLVKEIKYMLSFLNIDSSAANRVKATYTNHMKEMSISVLAYGSIENQQNVLQFIYEQAESHDKHKKGRNRESKTPPKPRIALLVERAIGKLVDRGKEENCTFRYRILNGVFNLLRMKQVIELVEAKKLKGSVKGPAMLSEELNLSMTTNAWKPYRQGVLVVNGAIDYNVAYDSLTAPSGKGLGATLNRTLNVKSAAETLDLFGSKSVKSSASAASSTRGGGKRTLVKPTDLLEWLQFTLEKNDYNGEKISIVLLALGLSPYIGKRPKKKRKGESDLDSAWGIESDAGSVVDEGEEEPLDDAMSVKTGGDVFDYENEKEHSKPKRLRRKSTLNNLANFLKDAKINVKQKFTKGNKMTSKAKVKLLEAASEFGSKPVLHKLLALIAPEIDAALLKCCFISTIGGRVETQRLLLDSVTKFVATVIGDNENNGTVKLSDLKTASSKSLRNGKSNQVENLLFAFQRYEDLISARKQLEKQRHDQKKKQLKLKAGAKGSKSGRMKSARKSITELTRSARRMSGALLGSVKSLGFGGRSSRNRPKTSHRRNNRGRTIGRQKKNSNNKLNLKPSAKVNKLHAQAIKNRSSVKKGKKNEDEDFDALAKAFAHFLTGLVRSASIYGKFNCATNAFKNQYANKEDCRNAVINVLKKQCGKDQYKNKDADRSLLGLINLLLCNLNDKVLNLPQLARDVLDEGTKHDIANINNLRYVINTLSEKYEKRFLTLEDLMFVISRSVEGNNDWELWPEVIELVFKNLSNSERKKIDQIKKMIKERKPKLKLSAPVKSAVNAICKDDFKSLKSEVEPEKRRRRSSMKDLYSNAKSYMKTRRGSSSDSKIKSRSPYGF